ncbi:MarR family winged helix-turn-helix transcriptional regulator [Vitiosangium sp. GDMCC 1.1324]|uniref:MarR family winged helix-turn-helix transcriptional regulator n=1 Tax=Vitiosangium sp. (strain GDMCC 1.1324) TaxID=2138576 RepID=UPI000D349AC2|nr:MarR family winged helix-turn-helix transcriptional regulator [Vitiosangium sp. GDMCC 1.1324]PTL82022.1 MarR family transcriptional regulator [Vitiosangium sp. GDMCC 1.1324]
MSRTPARLDTCNAFALRQATRHVSQLYEQHLAKAGLTGNQFSILGHLVTNGDLTMAQLAELLVMDRTTLVRALGPMKRDGLVVHRPREKGTRQLLLGLSDAGKARFQQALPHWAAAQAAFEARIGADAALAMRRQLLALTDSV